MNLKAFKKYCEDKNPPFVVRVVKKSDAYTVAHFRCALSVSLMIILALYYFPFYPVTSQILVLSLLPAVFLGHLIAQFSGIKRKFVLKREMNKRAHLAFMDILVECKMPLLFVSMFEKKAYYFGPEIDTIEEYLKPLRQEKIKIQKKEKPKDLIVPTSALPNIVEENTKEINLLDLDDSKFAPPSSSDQQKEIEIIPKKEEGPEKDPSD